MEQTTIKSFLSLIKEEEARRESTLDIKDDLALEFWAAFDQPFITELCLSFFVALRHHVERSLLWLAARAVDDGNPITRTEFKHRLDELRDDKNRWNKVAKRLDLDNRKYYETATILRELVNNYKHDAQKGPSDKLLNLLGSDRTALYAPLHESLTLQQDLARAVGLSRKASYPEIAERFAQHIEVFLQDIKESIPISRVSLNLMDPSLFAG